MKKILTIILISLILLLTILIYSRFLGIKGLKTNEIIIKDTIPLHYNGLKIVHLADIHYKKVITEKEINSLIKEINKIKPDLIIFTGDLIDNSYKLKGNDKKFLIKSLSKLETKYGTFATIGDQDIKEIEEIKNIYIQSNIILLDNTTTLIQNEYNEKISITGISSSNTPKIKNTIKNINTDSNYKIIAIHEPDYTKRILHYDNTIPLILSSHSINGSINIPLIKRLFLPNNAKKYFNHHYKINNTNLYITNGIGLNNINFRLFNKPSINFYRLKMND